MYCFKTVAKEIRRHRTRVPLEQQMLVLGELAMPIARYALRKIVIPFIYREHKYLHVTGIYGNVICNLQYFKMAV